MEEGVRFQFVTSDAADNYVVFHVPDVLPYSINGGGVGVELHSEKTERHSFPTVVTQPFLFIEKVKEPFLGDGVGEPPLGSVS